MKKVSCTVLSISLVTVIACNPPSRSKEKLYELFFEKPTAGCVQIFESRDVKAIDDQMLYLHFKACPEETKRLLSLVPYSFSNLGKTLIALKARDSSEDENLIPSTPVWFDIRKLGDSCIEFHYQWKNQDYAQTGFMSLDSTEVYYREDSW